MCLYYLLGFSKKFSISGFATGMPKMKNIFFCFVFLFLHKNGACLFIKK